MGDTILIETTADEVVSIVTAGPQGPSGAEAATLTTTGDLLYRAALANDRLPIGSEGQVLKVASGLPAWANESGAVTSVNGETGAVVLDAAAVGAAPSTGISPSAITGTAVVDNDARLSDSRTPTSHAASHAAAGSDPVFDQDLNTADSVEFVQVRMQSVSIIDSISGFTSEIDANIGLSDDRTLVVPDASGTLALVGDAPASHTHGNITNDGKVGSTAGLPLKTGTAGVVEAGAFGTSAGTFCEGNDARLSDSRTPTSHSASHAAAGSDPVFDQNLNTTDSVAFDGVEATGFRTLTLSVVESDLATGFAAEFIASGLTADREARFPDASGTIALLNDSSQGNIAASDITSGTLTHERGGLEADVSAYSGLVKIASGSTSAVTVTAAGEALLDDADAAAQRTTLGLGNSATLNTGTTAGTVAEGNHTHADLHTRSHAITSTSDHTAGNHKVFYSNGSGEIVELALGNSGEVLTSNGASAAPSFAAASGGATSQTDVFTANGTWTKPAGAKIIRAVLVGGGGGAGAGRRGAAGTVRAGGGGGGGAAVVAFVTDAAYFGATESITVGSGGNGGADSADDTNGASGSIGGDSSIGSLVTAIGGKAGGGGSTAGGGGGAATGSSVWFYGTATTSTGGGGGGSTGNAGGGGASTVAPTGGGGGGGINNSNNALAGGQSGSFGSAFYGQYNAQSTNPPTIQNGKDIPYTFFGTGGAGTRALQAGSVGNQGGDGARGGGGGGGSGALNGAGGSTAGGSGGNGIVVITTYF